MGKKILKHRIIGILSAASACFVAGGTLWAYFTLAAINGPIFIMHFNDISGITQVGSIETVIFIGILGLAIVVLNSFIAFAFEDRDTFLGKVIAVSTLLFAVLLFMAFAAILNVN